MADEWDNDADVAEETTEKTTFKKTGGMVKKILIVVAILSLQCIVAYILLTQILLPTLLSPKENSQASNASVPEAQTKKERPTLLIDEEPEVDYAAAGVYALDDLVINPLGSQGKRFLVLSMALMIKDEKGLEELENVEPAIKDGIIALLSRKTVAWFSEVNNREFLRREIRLTINRKLTDTQVLKVYFTKYVLQ